MYFITEDDKIKALIAELKRREQEVFDYQLNIDNLKKAIEKINFLGQKAPLSAPMQDYKQQLNELMEQNRIQQERSQIMLDVILDQLNGVDIEAYKETIEQ